MVFVSDVMVYSCDGYSDDDDNDSYSDDNDGYSDDNDDNDGHSDDNDGHSDDNDDHCDYLRFAFTVHLTIYHPSVAITNKTPHYHDSRKDNYQIHLRTSIHPPSPH